MFNNGHFCLSCLFHTHANNLHWMINICEKAKAFNLVQIKALLKERLSGKATGGSSEKSEISSSVELTSSNFDELVLKSKDLWIVEFFAPW